MAKAMTVYRDPPTHDVVRSAVFSGSDKSGKIARKTERGSRSQWKKGAPSVKVSSRMSVVSENIGAMKQKFAHGGEVIRFVEEEEEADEKEVAVPTKAKAKRPTKHTPKSAKTKSPALTAIITRTVAGPPLNETDTKTSMNVAYHISDIENNVSQKLAFSLNESVEYRKAASDLIGIIVDSAKHDQVHLGLSSGATLGIDTIEVVETATSTAPVDNLCPG
jgi:hypothetical protein